MPIDWQPSVSFCDILISHRKLESQGEHRFISIALEIPQGGTGRMWHICEYNKRLDYIIYSFLETKFKWTTFLRPMFLNFNYTLESSGKF